ncbi:MAG: ATPase domain-containing protein [Methanomassiliicoccales archaeon]
MSASSASTLDANKDDLYRIQLKGDELHAKLGGGLPKGCICLIEGEEGSGRSVLCQRLLYGVLNDNRSASFISTEMTIRDFIDQMWSINYRIDKYLISRKLEFFPVYPLIGNPTPSRDKFLDKMITSPVLYRNDLLFVDSLSTLVKSNFDERGVLRLLGFLKKLTKENKSIVLTAEKGHTALEALRLASDIYLSLELKQSAGTLARVINVKRFARARGEVGDLVRYRIEAGVGMIIEITEVSG